jgi:hypothetical protein
MKRNNTKKRPKQSNRRHASSTGNLAEVMTPSETARIAACSEVALTQSVVPSQDPWQKTPELMASLGLTRRVIIEKHLTPLLSATTMKPIYIEGKGMRVCKAPDNPVRLKATELVLQLAGAFPNTEGDKNNGVEVVIVDIPRPDHSKTTKTRPQTAASPETQSGVTSDIAYDPRPPNGVPSPFDQSED